ncbi:MAG: cell division protein FtsQ/DivIB [Bacteriovoracia bacterium]
MLALAGILVGIQQATRSPLFRLSMVEVVQEDAGAAGVTDAAVKLPIQLDEKLVRELSGAQLGVDNLFDLDLRAIERRILSQVWIREVTLEKKFPQTLRIAIKLRDPVALFQGADGNLHYLDSNGALFSQADSGILSDLPVVTGVPESDTDLTRKILSLLSFWKTSDVAKFTRLSGVTWDITRGVRAVVLYFGSPDREEGGPVRTFVNLGQNFDGVAPSALPRLGKVLQYLANHSIRSHLITLGDGKKIVVKTDRGS